MKKFSKKTKNLNKKPKRDKIILLVDKIIDHRLFKPVAISIVTSFLIFKILFFLQNLVVDYKEYSIKEKQITPIKIEISKDNINFDINEPQTAEYKIKSGDTLLSILIDTGAIEADIFAILEATKKVFNPKSILAGNLVDVKYKAKIDYETSDSGFVTGVKRNVSISSVEISPSLEKKIIISRNDNGEYVAKEIKIELVRKISRHMGVIESGLFIDGVASGLSPNAVMNMINLYSYDVDFQRDIRKGNKFEIVVESFYSKEGKKIKDGNILFSSLFVGGRSIDIYMNEVNGENQYFDKNGNSVRKSLLRTPINGARVSSQFGMRRHPVLGYSKMHKGIDFAAPSGTPILAAGSGTIVRYGWFGGYGKYVKIKHNSDYSTAYAHASRLVKKFRVGSKVKQGEVIAYVGTTGRSTGPHLHFELIKGSKQIDPSKVKATSGLRLTGRNLANFKRSKSKIEEYRKIAPNQNTKSKMK